MPPVALRLGDIAERIGAKVQGNPDAEVTGLGTLESGSPGQLTHLSSRAYRRFLAGTQATGVVLAAEDAPACPTNALVVANPYLAFAQASQLFANRPTLTPGVHPSAVIGEGVRLGSNVAVDAHSVIGAGTILGDGVAIGANCSIGEGCTLGADVRLYSSVTLYHGVRIGARGVLHSGAVIGADGFGFARDDRGRQVAIEQVGRVVLGADVSVGANTTIDRGAIGDTVIGDGVKIDNQVQIGHNCSVGDHTIICGCTGLAGSTRIGRHCIIAGGVGIAGDGPVAICDGVVVSGMTHVGRDIDKPGVYSGGVLHSASRTWKRNALRFADLDGLARRIAALERALAAQNRESP